MMIAIMISSWNIRWGLEESLVPVGNLEVLEMEDVELLNRG